VTIQLAGRTALVTGASRGIGQEVALQLAARGASLILTARSATQLAQTRDAALARGALPGQIHIVPADLGDSEQRDAAVAAALDTMQVDILINNAAMVEPLGATATIPVAELRRAFEINVIAPVALAGALLPGMVEAGWGRIVNISSGVVARPAAMIRGNTYAATKAALEAHTVNLAAELAGTGVTVNAYRPGGVDTAMQAWIRQQDPGRIGAALHARFNSNYIEGSLITPEHSASVLVDRLSGEDTGAIWDVGSASPVRS
jgi:NAD(P)-dependent dehydrogenase (short-subunit alcohol dehydrogenase family)